MGSSPHIGQMTLLKGCLAGGDRSCLDDEELDRLYSAVLAEQKRAARRMRLSSDAVCPNASFQEIRCQPGSFAPFGNAERLAGWVRVRLLLTDKTAVPRDRIDPQRDLQRAQNPGVLLSALSRQPTALKFTRSRGVGLTALLPARCAGFIPRRWFCAAVVAGELSPKTHPAMRRVLASLR